MYQCVNPLIAVNMFVDSLGKQKLKLFGSHHVEYNIRDLRSKFGNENVYLLPCGSCEACRKNYAKDWALRIALEHYYHKYAYFITLTYANQSLPGASKKDLRRFLDRLEGSGPDKQKLVYFACSEHGELNGRFHWHLILLCDKELTLIQPVKIGRFYHYHCKEISEKWLFGLHDISICEDSSCYRYVAKYTSKNGRVYMSRNIGRTYFDQNYDSIIKNNFKIYLKEFNNGAPVDIPQCFVKWFKARCCSEIDNYIDEKFKNGELIHSIKMFQTGSIREEDLLFEEIKHEKDKTKERRDLK